MAKNSFPPIGLGDPGNLKDRIKRLQRERDSAREREQSFEVPGKAYWNGYNSNNKPTVRLPSGRVIEVIKTFNTSLALGAVVYVDERRVIDGRSVPKSASNTKKKQALPQRRRRSSKKVTNKKSTPAPPPASDRAVGRTWLVYEEHYEPLPLMTNSGGGAAPVTESTEALIESFVATGGIGTSAAFQWLALGLFFDGWQVGFYTYDNTETIFLPENNPGLPAEHTGDEYTFFCLISGFLQRFYEGIGFGPEDGVFVGSNSISDLIYSIFSGDWHWAKIYMFSGDSYRYTSPIVAGIQHYGPDKLSFSFSRTVGVYPAKRFHINVVSWKTYEGASVTLVEDLNDLPGPKTSSRFTIPEDIKEWEYDRHFVYDVVAAHKPIEHYQTGNTMPDDLSKFAAYSGNELFLNYIIKCYSISDIDGSLAIFYIPLNLRVNEDGSFDYKIEDAGLFGAWNQPRHYLIREDPDFPIKGGPNKGGKIFFRAQFVGAENYPRTTYITEANCIVGGPKISGVVRMEDPDEGDRPNLKFIVGTGEPGQTWDPPNEDLPFALSWNVDTGYWEFDPNAFAEIIGPDESVTFVIFYRIYDGTLLSIEGPGFEADTASSIRITCYGSNIGSELPPGPQEENPEPRAPIVYSDKHDFQGTVDYNVLYTSSVIPVDPLSGIPTVEEEGVSEPFLPYEIIIPLEEEFLEQTYSGVGGETRNVLSYTNPMTNPIAFLNGRYYPYQSDISALTYDIVPELLVNESGKFYAIKITYAPEATSIQFLDQGEILEVVYEFRYGFNYAPYVGDYEDLSVFNQRLLRRQLAKNAFDNDWRKRLDVTEAVLNEETDEVEYLEISQEDIPVRDTNITPMNYDPVYKIFTNNFAYEFSVKQPAYYNNFSEIAGAIDGSSFNFTELIYPYYEDIPPITEINDPGGWGLRFYFYGDTDRLRPLTRELADNVLYGEISEVDPETRAGQYFLAGDTSFFYPFNLADATIIQENAKQVFPTDLWSVSQMPKRIRMSDPNGRSWRFEVKNSVIREGYIFTAYNREQRGSDFR